MNDEGRQLDAALSAPAPLAALDVQKVLGLFTDVDDTLTRDGKLAVQAYQALWDLHDAGIAVVPVTGRSFGWAHMMLAQWPVPAVIAESGGLYLARRAGTTNPLQVEFFDEPAAVALRREQLLVLCRELLRLHPQLRFASDNALRQVDVAIDYCEEVPAAPMDVVEEVIRSIRAAGFNARHSTVHINAWHGACDKGPMALRYLEQCAGLTPQMAREHWLFIGDAPNDASMFASFPRSVAVANIATFLPAMARHRPAFITRASHGEGFVELARRLLGKR